MSFFGAIGDTWQALVHLIIRPPRHEYTVQRDLGHKRLLVQGKLVLREDIELMNARGYVLKCSHFQPAELEDGESDMDSASSRLRPQRQPFPSVVYCHGNAGSRVDCLPVLPILLPMGISVFAFDFSGAGQSEGEYLSLGYYEKDDLATVVDYLKENERVTRIGLWGHSMGACTSLLYAADGGDQVVSAMVLDSSFSELHAVITETAASAKQKIGESVTQAITLIPDALIPMAVAGIRRSIMAQAGFDIRDVNPVDHCENLLVPALFGHAEQDEMVAPYHSIRLHEQYGGNSTLIRFKGSHNSSRSDFFLGSVAEFLRCILRPTDEPHPASGLVYHNAAAIRGLMAGTRDRKKYIGKGFRSHGLSMQGEKCFHVGRTAGNLSILANMCLECNPALRIKREATYQRAKSRRYTPGDDMFKDYGSLDGPSRGPKPATAPANIKETPVNIKEIADQAKITALQKAMTASKTPRGTDKGPRNDAEDELKMQIGGAAESDSGAGGALLDQKVHGNSLEQQKDGARMRDNTNSDHTWMNEPQSKNSQKTAIGDDKADEVADRHSELEEVVPKRRSRDRQTELDESARNLVTSSRQSEDFSDDFGDGSGSTSHQKMDSVNGEPTNTNTTAQDGGRPAGEEELGKFDDGGVAWGVTEGSMAPPGLDLNTSVNSSSG